MAEDILVIDVCEEELGYLDSDEGNMGDGALQPVALNVLGGRHKQQCKSGYATTRKRLQRLNRALRKQANNNKESPVLTTDTDQPVDSSSQATGRVSAADSVTPSKRVRQEENHSSLEA